MTLEAKPVSPGEALSGKLSGKLHILPTRYGHFVTHRALHTLPAGSYALRLLPIPADVR